MRGQAMIVAEKRYRHIYVEPLLFGQSKKPKQFSLTATAVELIQETAERLSTSNATVVECLIRGGGLDYANPPELSSWRVVEHYGEAKNKRPTYGLTPDASEMLSARARELDSNRAAVLESAIREGGLEKAEEYFRKLSP